MDRNTLFDCLVAWVNTFNLNVKCEGANDFKDGILIAKCLNNIDPEYFDEDWLSKIKDDTNDNWRLKLLNLKKILQRITDYYSEVLNHSLSDFEMPNLNLIVETNNNTTSVEANNQLSHLLQLVLGCAVNCERKSEFIKNIMEMNESTQHMIMTAIQELMSKDRNMNLIRQSTSSLSLGGVVGGTMSTSASMIASTTTASGGEADIDLAYQLKRAQVEISRLGELKEDIELKCQRLDKQVSELIDEKTSLASEIDFLRNKLQRHEDGDRSDPTNDINKQLRLQQKVDSMQEELYRLESEKEKYRIQFEAAKSEQDILLEKNIELKKVAQEHQNLRDEIDVLKHRSDRVEKLESTIESYKIKLEEMVDLKRQIKSLEENNTKYLEKILLMEEEVKKINALKSQIEMYKKQIQELHEQMLNDEMKSKKLEYEYKSLEERLNSLRAEKERLQSEYEKVKENLDKQIINNSNTNPALNDENGQPLTTMPTNDEEGSNQLMGDLFSTAELFNIPSDIKEKLVRLCHENKVLKSKQTEYNEERYFLIQSQLEDEKQRSGDLQTRLNETSKQKIEIECQLNDLRKTSKDLLEAEQHSRNATNPAVDSSRDELINDLKTKLGRAQAQLDDESKRNETALKSLEEKLELLSVEKNELKESREKELKAHEKEIKEMNEKYRGYLEKAKIVIKTLDPRNSTNGCSEVQFLKTQLAEKEKQIKQLMKENDKIRNSRDLEERLVTSAWQKLSSTLNRRSTDERVSSVGSSSFLSQQRHMPNSNSSSNSSTSSNNSATSVSGSPSSGPGLIHHSLSATNTPRQRSSNSFLSSLPKLNSPTPTN